MNKIPRSGLASNVSAILATYLSGRIIRFVYLIFVARLLPPEEIGIYIYGVALYLAFFGVSQFGQQGILSTRIGRSQLGILNLLAHSFTVRILATTIVTTMLLIFAVATEPEPRILVAVVSFVLTLIPRSIVLWVRNCYVALEQTAWIPRWETAFRTAEATAGILILYGGGGLVEICILHLFFWTIEAGAALRRLTVQARIPLRIGRDGRYLVKLVRQSVYFMLSLWLVDFFLVIGPVIFRRLQTDGALVGFFGVAMQFFTTFMVVFIALGDALLPKLSRSFKQSSMSGLRAVPLMMRLILVAGVPLALIANTMLPPFIELLLGERYSETGVITAHLTWSVAPFAFVILAMQSLNSARKPQAAVVVAALPAIIQVGLMLAWAGDGDPLRAAWSIVIASYAGAVISAVTLKLLLDQKGFGQNISALVLLMVVSQIMQLDFFANGIGRFVMAVAYTAVIIVTRLITVEDLKVLGSVHSKSAGG